MFAALHGELAFHPWWDAATSISDAYSLFFSRSSAMGWLDEATENSPGGVWGTNEAEQEVDAGSRTSRLIWFQVSLSEPIPAGRPLPVQAFLRCAGDVAMRIGTLRLRAVQVLLPLQASSPGDAMGQLLGDAGWFDDCDPHWRTPVRVVLDGGQDSSIVSASSEVLRWMRQLNQGVFSCESLSATDNEEMLLDPAVADNDDVLLDPAVTGEMWLRPTNYRVTFRGTLAEWSLDALGWLATFLAEANSRNGVSAPYLMLTASPSESLGSRID